jgi:ABC-type multidrug transport system ATPase subunit
MADDDGASGVLTVQRVSVSAGSFQILRRVSCTLAPGELCALIGPSGAGKSTLMKVMLGIREPTQGLVRVSGRAVNELGPLGYVPQDDAVHRTLTVVDELRFAAALRLPSIDSAARDKRIDEVMSQVGLSERRDVRISRLSGGQRKRVSVALELLTHPQLLILDEPTSGLDPGLEERMMRVFADVAKGGRIVLVGTHAMQSLELCDKLIVLVKGNLAYAGTPAGALKYFGADDYGDVFTKLQRKDGDAWGAQFAGATQ